MPEKTRCFIKNCHKDATFEITKNHKKVRSCKDHKHQDGLHASSKSVSGCRCTDRNCK